MSPNRSIVYSRFTQPDLSKTRQLLVRIGIFLCLLLFSGGIFFGPTGTGVAHASSTVLPYNANGDTENPPLQLYNGAGYDTPFVQHHPKVFLVFWGPAWQTDPDGVIPQVTGTFRALAGSEYNNILSQYNDSSDYVHNDVQVAAAIIDSSTPPSNLDIGFETNFGVWDNAQIRNEADKEITANNWSVNRDSQVIVFPQKGSTYNHGSGWCGVHSYDSTAASPYAYAEIQYGDQWYGATTAPCDPAGDPAEDITMSAVHEYAEAATDPVIFVTPTLSGSPWYTALSSGWHTEDSSKSSPQEVADLCEGYNSSVYAEDDYQDPHTLIFYTLPLLWSNFNNGCVSSIGQDYVSPDVTPPFHGVHTVQGSILSEYTSVGANTGILGEPTSEETPIAGGRVSYFKGPCNGNGPSSSCAAIYWSPATGTHAIWGNDYLKYLSIGGPTSHLGFPTSDPIFTGGGAYTLFQDTSDCGGLGTVNGSCAAIFDKSGVGTYANWGNDLKKYMSEGGPGGSFGYPMSDPIFTDGGAYTLFQDTSDCGGLGTVNGSCAAIFDKGGIGTYANWGNDLKKYMNEGGPDGSFGYPTSDPIFASGGAYTLFQGSSYCGAAGSVTVSGSPASCAATFSYGSTTFADWGDDLHDYMSLGGPGGSLGWTLSDPQGIAGGAASYFTANHGCGTPGPDSSDGAIYFSSGTGAHAVYGCIYAFYQQTSDGSGGVLGYPVSDETGITDSYGTGGRVNYFTGNDGCGTPGPARSDGAIYWTGAGYQVYGCIYGTYMANGGPGGVLGFPVSSEYTNALGYRETDFFGGDIVWENGNGVVTVW